MNDWKNTTPENIIRNVVDKCADCDSCRYLMDETCLFFPELYRLWDREKESGIALSEKELHELTLHCTYCGLCPCPDIRAGINLARCRFVEKQGGLPVHARLLADVQGVGKTGSIFPQFVNFLNHSKASGVIKQILDIHPNRSLPLFPDQHFFQWAKNRKITEKAGGDRKIAYFVGCTAAYLFPEIPKAVVKFFRINGIRVYIPPQQCCGMPTFAEGVRGITLNRVQYNLRHLLDAIRDGYDVVCSCPSCGYFFKMMLLEKACYADAYQRMVGAKPDEILLPADDRTGAAKEGFIRLQKNIYQNILKDDGYFSEIDPLNRIQAASHVYDLGEYLLRFCAGNPFHSIGKETGQHPVYYPPCHMREQKIGAPYETILKTIPGTTIETVGGSLDCCGMGGSLGFKKDFYEKSLQMGQPLVEKLRTRQPSAIITECLSCRIQFLDLLDCPVFHPVELLCHSEPSPPV